jgi:hypothetical protein
MQTVGRCHGPEVQPGESNAEPHCQKDIRHRARQRQKEMSSLEFVQGLVNGALPLNTIAQTLDYDITEVESGRVVITA